MITTKNKHIFILLGICGILYALSINAYFVGFFNDDAFYLIGARALTHGHYVELNQPGYPPLVNYWPGYSMLLMPITAVFKNSNLPHQIFSILLCLGALIFLSLATKKELTPFSRISFLVLAGISPLVISLSGTILSDIPYFTLTCLIMWWIQKIWNKGSISKWFLLAFSIGFLVLIRPVGITMAMAVGLILLIEKRWRLGVMCLLVPAFFGGLFYLRNYLLMGIGTHYLSEMSGPYFGQMGLTKLVGSWWINLKYYLYHLFVHNFFRWPNVPGRGILVFLTVILGVTSVILGIIQARQKRLAQILIIYLIFYGLIHLSWPKQSGRYLLPLVPIVLYFFIEGLARLDGIFGAKKILLGGVVLVSLMLNIFPIANIVRASMFKPNKKNSPPLETINWVLKNTQKDDIFAVELDGAFYLHTGRPTIHLRKIFDSPLFHQWLKANGVKYVLFCPSQYSLKSIWENTRHDPYPTEILLKNLSDKGLYIPIFISEADGATIYQIAKK